MMFKATSLWARDYIPLSVYNDNILPILFAELSN